MTQQKITPFLWFDKDAKEAAKLYTSVFKDSKITSPTTLNDTPSGSVDIISIELSGQQFTLMNAGPHVAFNPSVSFHIKCKTADEVDAFWEKLSDGGRVLMELGKYPFSEKYGWLQDRYGVSWQIIYVGNQEMQQKIIPVLMFVGDVYGEAKEAMTLYTSIFHNSTISHIQTYGKGEKPDEEGTVKYASFKLEGLEFGAMDSAYKHNFAFNDAISFVIDCNNQQEVDYFWEKLTADGGEESMCGWLKDKFGISWQVVPRKLNEMLAHKDPAKAKHAMDAMLKMKKIIVADL